MIFFRRLHPCGLKSSYLRNKVPFSKALTPNSSRGDTQPPTKPDWFYKVASRREWIYRVESDHLWADVIFSLFDKIIIT